MSLRLATGSNLGPGPHMIGEPIRNLNPSLYLVCICINKLAAYRIGCLGAKLQTQAESPSAALTKGLGRFAARPFVGILRGGWHAVGVRTFAPKHLILYASNLLMQIQNIYVLGFRFYWAPI